MNTPLSRAPAKHTKLSARKIAQESMPIAANICVFTTTNFVIEELQFHT